ncbi:MAG: DNA polymerase III subunit gamma/tau [Elusimicrobia bacterium]|nr:DNA polymerase III subunit gamma/tau [Elusimicrobiota bacterium]
MAQESRIPLTLKYRPGFFRDIVGQEAISRALSNAIVLNRVHPAYLFYGPRGSGKTSMARIFARALNCGQRAVPSEAPNQRLSAEPCGACPLCREITDGRSMDVLEIDAASHTQVDHIREVVLDTVALVPSKGRYRIFIIDEVHQLSGHSFNAMLKTLEEPPGHVIFILATTEFAKVPLTVVSRTQSFPFRAFSRAEIEGRLRYISEREGLDVAGDAVEAVAVAASGSLRDAVSIFEQLINLSESGRRVTREDLRRLLGYVADEAIAALLEAVVIRPDFVRSREILSDILFRQGHAPSQVMAGLLRAASERMIESLSGREPILARRTYRFIEHLSHVQSLVRSSLDPILVCETGVLGFFLEEEDSLVSDRPVSQTAAIPRSSANEGAAGLKILSSASSAGALPLKPPPAMGSPSKNLSQKPSPGAQGASSGQGREESRGGELGSAGAGKTGASGATQGTLAQLHGPSATQPSPVFAPATVMPVAPGHADFEINSKAIQSSFRNPSISGGVPETAAPVPAAVSGVQPAEAILKRFQQSLEDQGLGIYLADAQLQDAPNGSSAREMIVANEFCLQGLEKNKDKLLRAWKAVALAGPLPALRVMTKEELAAASASRAERSSAKGPAAPLTASDEVPEEIREIAKEFGGKIKRIKRS